MPASSPPIPGAGDIALTGYFLYSADFGLGPIVGPTTFSVFLTKVDSAGNTLWNNAFPLPAVLWERFSLDVASDGRIGGIKGLFGPTIGVYISREVRSHAGRITREPAAPGRTNGRLDGVWWRPTGRWGQFEVLGATVGGAVHRRAS